VSNFEQLPTQPSSQRVQVPQGGAPVQGYWVLTGAYRDCRVSAGEMRLKPVYRWVPNCMCAQCLPRIKRALSGLFEMVLCPTCGNKRCPHANDHRHACTGSNEPGQPGSRY
jgi:hypothetical protein